MKAIIISILALALSSFALTSCASMGASSTEPLLSAAGFRVKTPENEAQKRIYAELPAYKIQRGTHEGKVFYAYKDEKQGVAYIGGEEEYQKFQQLATERSIARTQYEAAQMNREMSYRFYGAYPRYRYW
jgi:hypothetical protein